MVSAQDFRDCYVETISIRYPRAGSAGAVDLSVLDSNGLVRSFRLNGVTALAIDEDFESLAIARCTFVVGPDGAYLSLDPFEEGVPSDRDNYFFRAASVEQTS